MLKKFLMLFLIVGFFGLTFAGERNVPAPETVYTDESAEIICPDVCKNAQPVAGEWDSVNNVKNKTGWSVSDNKHFCKCKFIKTCWKEKCNADGVKGVRLAECQSEKKGKYWSNDNGENCIPVGGWSDK